MNFAPDLDKIIPWWTLLVIGAVLFVVGLATGRIWLSIVAAIGMMVVVALRPPAQ